MTLQLLKKNGTYKDGNGGEKSYTNFYLKCGNSRPIPIEVKYFEDKTTGKDDRYRGRKDLLEAFAEDMPEQDEKGSKTATGSADTESVDESSGVIPF